MYCGQRCGAEPEVGETLSATHLVTVALIQGFSVGSIKHFIVPTVGKEREGGKEGGRRRVDGRRGEGEGGWKRGGEGGRGRVEEMRGGREREGGRDEGRKGEGGWKRGGEGGEGEE